MCQVLVNGATSPCLTEPLNKRTKMTDVMQFQEGF